MKVILATRNPSKAEQIRAIFRDLPISILTITDADIKGDAIEDGVTLQENALKKALFVYKQIQPKTWVMADDTGLFINALNGAPGIKSSRWAGEDANTEQIMEYTLRLLKDTKDRSAVFETAIAVISPEGDQRFFNGRVQGHILEAPRTLPQPKMPYSSIFMPEGTNLVWAEMTVDYENSISHRGKAFKQVYDFLNGILNK